MNPFYDDYNGNTKMNGSANASHSNQYAMGNTSSSSSARTNEFSDFSYSNSIFDGASDWVSATNNNNNAASMNQSKSSQEMNIFEGLTFENDSGGWQDSLLQHSPRQGQTQRQQKQQRQLQRPDLSRNRSVPISVNENLKRRHRQNSSQDGASFNFLNNLNSLNTHHDGSADVDMDNNLSPRSELLASVGRVSASSSRKGISFNDDEDYTHPLIANEISSRLHDAARVRNWAEVIKLAKESPTLAKFSGNEEMTALHHACGRRPPAEVVEVLLRAYPDALLAQDKRGWNPLHYACRFKASLQVFQNLLQLYPKRAKKAIQIKEKIYRRKPFFFAVRYDAPDGVVEMLLDVDSSSVLEEDKNGESPLSLVWTSYRETTIGKKTVEKYKEKAKRGEQIILKRDNSFSTDTLFAKAWAKVEFLLQYALKRTYPSENNQPKDWKMLHATCSIQCHNTLFYISLGLYPEQIKQTHARTGRTALHNAAMSPATGEGGLTVVSTLLNRWPEASREHDTIDSSLPLHLVAENANKYHWSLHGAKVIYNSYPEAVTIKDNNGKLPLHRACMSLAQIYRNNHYCRRDIDRGYQSYNVIFQILSAYPKAAQEKDTTGQIPLHILAANAAYWDSDVQAVFDAFPKGVHARDNLGRLPIHLAAMNPHASSDLIETLLKHNPRGAQMIDGAGRFPLHLACGAGYCWEQKLKSLYYSYKPAINMPDHSSKRWTPLHHACASPGPRACALIETLLTLDSTSGLAKNMVEMKDSLGRYPLHLACASGKSWNGGVGKLFEIFPPALIEIDNIGLLPWHNAALSGAKVANDSANDHYSDDSDDEEEIDILESEEVLDKVNTMFELLVGDPSTIKRYNP